MLKRYGKDGAQVLRKDCILNCHQNGFQCALLFSTSTLFVFFFMNTILKSFLFNFLPPGPLYLICGISWKDNSPWRARSWWLKWTVKKGRKKIAPTTGWKGKLPVRSPVLMLWCKPRSYHIQITCTAYELTSVKGRRRGHAKQETTAQDSVSTLSARYF